MLILDIISIISIIFFLLRYENKTYKTHRKHRSSYFSTVLFWYAGRWSQMYISLWAHLGLPDLQPEDSSGDKTT